MQESPPPSAENIGLQLGVDGFPMDDNNTSVGDRPTNLLEEVFSKAMEEHGCELLLQKLQERKLEDIKMIFSEVKDYIYKLMFNRFGSDVILKLFQVCDEEQKNQLISLITSDARLLISVCMDPQGSESMQKFLGLTMTQKQNFHIMCVLSYFTVLLANHPIGSRVIGHCFKIFPVPAKETKPILDMIADHCLEIAVDENGSNLLRVLISGHYIKGSGVGHIVATILSERYYLSVDPFGSSVMQSLIELEQPDLLQELVDGMQGGFANLSYDKYASDVVKKLIGALRGKYATQIISDIIKDPEVSTALADPHGVSLLKFAQNYTTGTAGKVLRNLIRQYSQPLKKK